MTIKTQAVGPGSGTVGKATTDEQSRDAIKALKEAIEHIEDGIKEKTNEGKEARNQQALDKMEIAENLISRTDGGHPTM